MKKEDNSLIDVENVETTGERNIPHNHYRDRRTNVWVRERTSVI